MQQFNIEFTSIDSLKEELHKHNFDLHSDKILIQVFTSVMDKEKIVKVTQEIAKVMPNATLFGASTAGEIVDGKMLEQTISLSISVFESTTISSCYSMKKDSKELGQELFENLATEDGNAKCIISFVDGLMHNGEDVLEGMNLYNYDGIPIAGGMSGDLNTFTQTFTIFNNNVFSGGGVCVLLSGDKLEAHQDYNLGWRAIGPYFTITKSHKNVVYEIENIPVRDLYRDVLGENIVKKLPASTIEFPLLEETKDGLIARSMIGVESNGGIVFAGNLAEGTRVQFGIGSKQLTSSYEPSKEVLESNIQAVFIYSCKARKQFLGKNLEATFSSLNTIAPTIGFFTFGEFYSKHAHNNFLNITSTFLFLHEKDSVYATDKFHTQKQEQDSLSEEALYNLIDYTTKKSKFYEKELSDKNFYLEDYLKKINSVLVVSKTNTKGIITEVNDLFVQISGYSEAELIGQPHNIVRHPDNSALMFKDLWSTIQNKQIWQGSFANLAKDGSVYHVKTAILPILNSDGTIKEYLAIREDITDLVIASQELKKQEEYSNMLLDTKDSIVVVIKNDELIALNDKFYEEFPYKDLEAFTSWHKCICDLFIQREGYLYKGDQRNWYKDILLSPHKTHKALMKNRNNESIVYSVTAKQTQLNEDSYIVAHFYDITELEEAKLAAQSALEAKGNFLANMSHEIRTPMNGILGFVDLMQNTQLDDNQTKYMSTIKNSTNTLLTIINDILDFSKLDSNKLEIEYIPADIKALSANVFSILKPLALKKSLKCNLEMDEDLAPCLLLDSTRLSQILTNLSSNAIKFTPDNGSVINRVKVIKTTHSSQTILFEVIDTGIGIALENQEKIFKAFSQENDSTTRKFGGTGLGLSISVQLVESMGGKLEVESTQGEGSRFYFTLELQRCSQAEAKEKRESNKGAQIAVSLKDKNILIAEDYDINRMLMENILEPEGAKVSFAHDGAEAVSMVRENDNYDIIFMDINMPVMNGIDATHALREELGCEVPIIALTANAIEGDKERFIAEGMSDYLSKPINIDALNRVLTQWLPVMQHETQEQTQEEASFSLEEVIVATQKSLGMDESIIIKMLQRLAESIDTTLEELESAIQMQEYETIAAIAHKLKGTAGSLNLTPLYKWLIKLEEMALSESSGDYLGLYAKIHEYYDRVKKSIANKG